MKKRTLIILISACAVIGLGIFFWQHYFVEPEDIIKYSDEHQIGFEDFRGRVDKSKSSYSNSGGEIKVLQRFGCSNGRVSFKIYAFMYPNESWIVDKTDSLSLMNQRLKFKCYELFARKLRKQLLEDEAICKDDLYDMGERNYEDLLKFIEVIGNDLSVEDQKEKKAKLLDWTSKVDELLAEYKDYTMEEYNFN